MTELFSFLIVLLILYLVFMEKRIMSALDDLRNKIGELEAEVSAQSAQIDETISTLGELKALLEQGTDAAVVEAIARIDAQIQALKAKRGELDTAEEAADPTPDTP